ncbi:MAG: hypothetical protein KDC38_15935, partial [Planctomycetes bacterium]|nr:hypothetical protein [Planctomycetota bacterium]
MSRTFSLIAFVFILAGLDRPASGADTVFVRIGQRMAYAKPDVLGGSHRYDVLRVELSPACAQFHHSTTSVSWGDEVRFEFGEGSTLGEYVMTVRHRHSWRDRRGRRKSKDETTRLRLVLLWSDPAPVELAPGEEIRVPIPEEIEVQSVQAGKRATVRVDDGALVITGVAPMRSEWRAKITYNFRREPRKSSMHVNLR